MKKHCVLSSVPALPGAAAWLMCSSPLSYLNSEGPVIPLKVSLNPNKTSSSLLSATSHAPCSYGLFYVWCCFVLVICRVGHVARLSDPLGHRPSLFIFILQLSAYSKHLINAYWINFGIVCIQSLEIFIVNICVCSYQNI